LDSGSLFLSDVGAYVTAEQFAIDTETGNLSRQISLAQGGALSLPDLLDVIVVVDSKTSEADDAASVQRGPADPSVAYGAGRARKPRGLFLPVRHRKHVGVMISQRDVLEPLAEIKLRGL
jgi:hypothetical protein